MMLLVSISFSFFFNPTAPSEIYALSLHDALPIWPRAGRLVSAAVGPGPQDHDRDLVDRVRLRSEEHTSELQSQFHLVCRLLLEKKKNIDLKHIDDLDELLAVPIVAIEFMTILSAP